MTALLEVRDLVKRFEAGGLLRGARGTVHAVNGVSFELAPGETLAWWVSPAPESPPWDGPFSG